MVLSKWKEAVCLLFAAMVCSAMQAVDVVWHSTDHRATYAVYSDCDAVVKVAIGMFAGDIQQVTGFAPRAATYKDATIRLVQWDKCSARTRRSLQSMGLPTDTLASLTDGFILQERQGHIYIIGCNGRGTAYGLLQLSRMAGVSPWVWWGDVVPVRQQSLSVPQHFSTIQGASVEWRGIFLNDEDWSTRPWSMLNHDPGEAGVIGTKTYRRIFELLLRLRANAIWPAMHGGTRAFFHTPGAKEMADSCGIAIGTSHCEPLLRNNVEEWDVKKRGPFNYITNRQQVTDYWTERLQQVKASVGGNLFTIGMRGIHDGSMEGVKTMEEKTNALQQVIDDQQQLIARHIGKPEKQMQVFVPYKEVLEIYERGLRVPPYVTLMWCDDNYGYITRLSNVEEQQRSGGAGVYYHLSYWGRPHDYLWLTTTQPGLVYHEMRAAYDHHARKLWIVNVHDVKAAGYDLELFLDMAWNINAVSHTTVGDHYRQWLCRQFGTEVGNAIWPAMHEFYRLCGERRPEFMGWNQTELSKVTYDRGVSQVRNTEFSTTAFGGELDNYLLRFDTVCRRVVGAEVLLRPELHDAYFAAVRYPVECAAAHAVKMLEAQRARQIASGGAVKSVHRYPALLYVSVARSMDAYQRIRQLTAYYNET
ncbi:MAG: glycosyl hydrolase 115 family protein, partial [Prevotella sp.]